MNIRKEYKWRGWYIALAVVLLLQIVFYYWFTQKYK